MEQQVGTKATGGQSRKLRAQAWIHSHAYLFVLALAFALMGTGLYSAAETTSSATVWNAVMGEAMAWITRLGILVLVIGAIMFALGFRNDDAEQKTRGLSTMVAGGMVGGICLIAGQFLTI